MSWSDEDNMIHVHDREESRDAMMFADAGGACFGAHRMRNDGTGGGSCTSCGMSVSAAEL